MILMSKIKLDIVVRHMPEGKRIPIKILWKDGRQFHIDKVLDIRKAAALKCGGIGIRYICKICNKEVAIFDEEGSWFIEK